MFYYDYHIGDFRSATNHMNRIERAIYRDLLDIYYDTEMPLPLDKLKIYRMVSARESDEMLIVDQILDDFFILDEYGYRNKRADHEIDIYRKKAESARENGKKGGRPPKNNQKKTQLVLLANPEESESKANQITNKPSKPSKPPNPQTPTGLNDPKKRGAISLKTFVDDCKEKNERPLRDYKPLWTYAEKVGLTEDYIALAWAEFLRRFMPGCSQQEKRQKDWRCTFKKYIENNYFKLWAIDQNGIYFLTTTGKQAEKFQG